VTLNDGASLSGGSTSASYVSGPITKIGTADFTFPVGDGSIFSRIGISGLGSTGTFTAQYSDAAYSDLSMKAGLYSVSGIEYWDLSRSAGVGEPFVTLYWENGTRSEIGNPATLKVAHFDGADWEDKGNSATTGNAAAGSVTSNFVFDSFSPVTLGSGDDQNPLPVELLSFNASTNEDGVKLEWSTASEYNNDYFTIEKSKDGVGFDTVMDVAGAGFSNEVLEYTEIDNFPFTGISYYRLKQTDFDGTESYSSIVSVMNVNSVGEVTFDVFPNPSKAGDELEIMVRNLNAEESVKINIVDLAGNSVFDQILNANAAGGLRTKFLVDAELASGIYIVNVITEKSKINKKLLIK